MLLQIIFDTIPFINETQYAIAPLVGMALAGGAIKAGTGLYQTMKGNKMSAPQSDFEIPSGYADRMKRLKMREATAGTLPGQDIIENKIGASTSQAITAMRESGNQASFQDSIAQFTQREQDRLAELGIKAAQRKDQLADDVTAGMKDLEGYQLMKQDRKFDKEAAKLAEKQALKGSGMQNLMGALDVGTSLAASGAFGGGKV